MRHIIKVCMCAPNATLGCICAPNATLGCIPAPNATLSIAVRHTCIRLPSRPYAIPESSYTQKEVAFSCESFQYELHSHRSLFTVAQFAVGAYRLGCMHSTLDD